MDEDLQRWVESGSVGGDVSDDGSESEPESDDDEDDEEEEENLEENLKENLEENLETAATDTIIIPPTKPEDPRVTEQTASAIFSLLKPNMERILLLGSIAASKSNINTKAKTKAKPSSLTLTRNVKVETIPPPPIPPRNVAVVNQLAEEAKSMHIDDDDDDDDDDDERFPRKRAGETATSSPRKFRFRRAVSNETTRED